ncbi:MAG: M48 family metallopeptidase [Vampirovibrio sp.]|nr:M48 family metallopeptidase [Vampirovibrio sp.]
MKTSVDGLFCFSHFSLTTGRLGSMMAALLLMVTISLSSSALAMRRAPAEPAPSDNSQPTSTQPSQQSSTPPAEEKAVLAPAAYQESARTMLSKILSSNQLPASTVQQMIVVESDTLNAATNGQEIQFTRKLWDTLQTDDQRGFVLSHELAHITLNHVPKAQARRVGIFAADKILGHVLGSSSQSAGVLRQISQAGLVLADLRYSRGAELSADDRGLTLMENAGYNPQGAIETLEILDKASGSSTPQFLRSHPMSKNRIQALVNKHQGRFQAQ